MSKEYFMGKKKMSYDYYNPISSLVRKLENDPDAYISGEELANALKMQEPIPEPLLSYFIRFLNGDIKMPKGAPHKPINDLRDILAYIKYQYYMAWLKRRKKTQGLKGWSCIEHADWWDINDPPHLRAKKMIRHRLYKNHTVESVSNIITKVSQYPIFTGYENKKNRVHI
jgi:hypothetical protein